MSTWQDFTVVFYALTLAVLGNALLWGVSRAFIRLLERAHRGLPPAAPDRHASRPRAAQLPRSPLPSGLAR